MDSLTKKVVENIGENRIELIKEIETGLNTLWEVEFEGKKAVLKIHTEKDSDDEFFHNYEGLMVQRLAKETSLAVPEVYCISHSTDPSYMIIEYVEGYNGKELVDKLDREERIKFVEEFGKQLDILHSNVQFEDFAYLRKENDEIIEWRTFETWQVLFMEHLRIDLNSLEDTGFSEFVPIAGELVRNNIGALEDKFQPVAIHDDNRHDNLIWNDGLKAVIDWATGFNGTAGFDIVKAEFLLIDHDLRHLEKEEKEKLRDSLYKGYGKDFRKNEELWTLYMTAHIIWTMKGFSNWSKRLKDDERKSIEENVKSKLDDLSD